MLNLLYSTTIILRNAYLKSNCSWNSSSIVYVETSERSKDTHPDFRRVQPRLSKDHVITSDFFDMKLLSDKTAESSLA